MNELDTTVRVKNEGLSLYFYRKHMFLSMQLSPSFYLSELIWYQRYEPLPGMSPQSHIGSAHPLLCFVVRFNFLLFSFSFLELSLVLLFRLHPSILVSQLEAISSAHPAILIY